MVQKQALEASLAQTSPEHGPLAGGAPVKTRGGLARGASSAAT